MIYYNNTPLSITELGKQVSEETRFQNFGEFYEEIKEEGEIEGEDGTFRFEDTKGFSLDKDFTVEA